MILGAVTVEWKSIKGEQGGQPNTEEASAGRSKEGLMHEP